MPMFPKADAASFVEMGERIQVDYKTTITRQAVTITKQAAIISSNQELDSKLKERLVISDRKLMLLEQQNETQQFIILRLNAEMRQKDEKISQCHTVVEEKNQLILQLTQQNQALLRSCNPPDDNMGSASTIDQIRGLFEEFRGELKRKRGDGDRDSV